MTNSTDCLTFGDAQHFIDDFARPWIIFVAVYLTLANVLLLTLIAFGDGRNKTIREWLCVKERRINEQVRVNEQVRRE